MNSVAYVPALTWANPTPDRLEDQALAPMFGEAPVEPGLAGLQNVFLERLRADARYAELFRAAFPDGTDPFTVDNLTRSLAAFQRTLISFDAPYDRYRRGEVGAMSASALRGEALFTGERLQCARCHVPPFFTSAVDHEALDSADVRFFNNGIESGPFKGIGQEHPNKSDFVSGFEATPVERTDLMAFLHALTDSTFLTDPRFSDPWLRGRGR